MLMLNLMHVHVSMYACDIRIFVGVQYVCSRTFVLSSSRSLYVYLYACVCICQCFNCSPPHVVIAVRNAELTSSMSWGIFRHDHVQLCAYGWQGMLKPIRGSSRVGLRA